MATQSSILAWRTPWTEPWQATVYRVAKSRIQLKRISMHVQAPFIYELIKSPPKLFEIIILSPFYRRGDWEFK